MPLRRTSWTNTRRSRQKISGVSVHNLIALFYNLMFRWPRRDRARGSTGNRRYMSGYSRPQSVNYRTSASMSSSQQYHMQQNMFDQSGTQVTIRHIDERYIVVYRENVSCTYLFRANDFKLIFQTYPEYYEIFNCRIKWEKEPVMNGCGINGWICYKVPKVICQPVCQQSDYCNSCSQFARSGGFQRCGSSNTCTNFVQ